jgi:hypothetical protein
MARIYLNVQALSTTYYNDEKKQLFTKNNCEEGSHGTTVEYIVAAETYSSIISKDDANTQALADIAANGQNYANDTGDCINDNNIATLLIDYFADTAADICMYCETVGVTENEAIVASTANGGPLLYPNDGRDPSTCALLSSDKLPGTPVRRFGINLAFFIAKYPAIDIFTWYMDGRSDTSKAVTGVYAKRDITQGYFVLADAGSGLKIPAVAGASPGTIGYSTNVIGGADGSVGVGVGAHILKFQYTVSTDDLVVTSF